MKRHGIAGVLLLPGRQVGALLVCGALLWNGSLLGQEPPRERKTVERVGDTPLVSKSRPLAGAVLSRVDVDAILARTVAAARAEGLKATIVITDREANVLASFRMTDAPQQTRIKGRDETVACALGALSATGLDGCQVPSIQAARSKAGTASFFATTGNAFTTRTAGFIVQQHFPPTIALQAGGPLFGVQFSSLPCTDITVPLGATSGFLPLGLSADPGGVPLYKGGEPVGGLGVEGDGFYTADLAPLESPPAEFAEERAAVNGSAGFEPPALIRGDQILVNGIRLPYTEIRTPLPSVTPSATLDGTVLQASRDALPSRFAPQTLGGVEGTVLVDAGGANRFPIKAGAAAQGLSAADVQRVLTQAAQTTLVTRAAIRQPLGSNARVSITVVDVDGGVLGFFRTADAPIFGVDVSAQKARTAAFFSSPGAAAALRAAGFGRYVDAAAADGVRLDGSLAFSDRGNGFLSRPFYPDGIDPNANGPFSRPISEWSVFNTGLQLDLIKSELVAHVAGVPTGRPCSAVPGLPHGIQIFAGSVPLYKNGTLVGAIGISGDGIDQDDFIGTNGSAGFEAPAGVRCDTLFVRGVRLPWVKFPRHPQL